MRNSPGDTSNLRWRRDSVSGWWAYGEQFGYQLRRDPSARNQWRLFIREVIETAGIRHTLGQPVLHIFGAHWFETLALGKDTVARFEAMPTGERNLYEAIYAAYAAEREQRLALPVSAVTK